MALQPHLDLESLRSLLADLDAAYLTQCHQAIAAAKWYAIMGARNNQDLPFWDDHALDMQRFYSILGILYGGDPNRFNFVEQIVPKDSLGRFRHDYPRKLMSWERLLSSHFRNKRPLGQNLKI